LTDDRHNPEGTEMAKTLKTWPSKRRPCSDPYPWSKWFDGQVWEIRQGVDYQTRSQDFRCHVLSAAKARGLKVKTAVIDNGAAVAVQALTKEKS
jgi:hypothetical protein